MTFGLLFLILKLSFSHNNLYIPFNTFSKIYFIFCSKTVWPAFLTVCIISPCTVITVLKPLYFIYCLFCVMLNNSKLRIHPRHHGITCSGPPLHQRFLRLPILLCFFGYKKLATCHLAFYSDEQSISLCLLQYDLGY